MFGHNDDQQHATNNGTVSDTTLDSQAMAAQADDIAGEYIDDMTPSNVDAVQPGSAFTASDTSDTNEGAAPAGSDFDASPSTSSEANNSSQGTGFDTAALDTSSNFDDQPEQALLEIKQRALEQLMPLVDRLDQKPEEKFRTTMMMIQASDNYALIQTAYDAAQQIANGKVKARALLDIVNEINYFTNKNKADSI